MSCILSFKKEAKVYVVYKGTQYRLDVSEINFGQTFSEHTYSNKTIQVQNMFEQVVINKANPATFEITFPAIREGDLRILFNRALDSRIFDIYIETPQDVFEITNCVISDATFLIDTSRPLGMSVSGEGIRLIRYGDYGISIPGTPYTRTGTITYNKVSHVNVVLGGAAPVDSLIGISINLNTEIKWTPYTTINDALNAIDADSTMYPKDFVVQKKDLSGAFSQHDFETLTFSEDTTLFIGAGETDAGTFYGFEFDISNASFQTKPNTGDIFTQEYSWRMTQNPASLLEVISYLTIVDSTGAILDSWNQAILDSSGLPILESI